VQSTRLPAKIPQDSKAYFSRVFACRLPVPEIFFGTGSRGLHIPVNPATLKLRLFHHASGVTSGRLCRSRLGRKPEGFS